VVVEGQVKLGRAKGLKPIPIASQEAVSLIIAKAQALSELRLENPDFLM